MKSLQLTQPHVLIMAGIPGSGKTTFAHKFADTFGAPYVSLERVKPHVTDDKAAAEILHHQIAELIKTHQTIVIDGFANTRTERSELMRMARSKGYETLIIWVQTDPATAKLRSQKSSQLSSDDYDRAFRHFTPPNAAEKPVVISGKHTYASQTKVVLKKLSEPRASISVHATAPTRETSTARRSITVR